jgi:hypothetical protein
VFQWPIHSINRSESLPFQKWVDTVVFHCNVRFRRTHLVIWSLKGFEWSLNHVTAPELRHRSFRRCFALRTSLREVQTTSKALKTRPSNSHRCCLRARSANPLENHAGMYLFLDTRSVDVWNSTTFYNIFFLWVKMQVTSRHGEREFLHWRERDPLKPREKPVNSPAVRMEREFSRKVQLITVQSEGATRPILGRRRATFRMLARAVHRMFVCVLISAARMSTRADGDLDSMDIKPRSLGTRISGQGCWPLRADRLLFAPRPDWRIPSAVSSNAGASAFMAE